MKYTNMEVTSMYEKLNTVYKSNITFPAKVSYAIVRNFNILAPIYGDIMKTRENIIRDNGTYVKDGLYYQIAPEKQDFVHKELTSLGEALNEVNLIKIKIADIEKLELPINIMDGLFCMIEDEG